MDRWFVFATLGEMTIREVVSECQSQSWVPIVIVKMTDKTIVPCFSTQENAIKFAKRNLLKEQVFGTTLLTDEDLKKLNSEWIEGKGWQLDFMSHPRLMKDLGQIDIEVYEFNEKPDVYGTWGKQCQKTKILSES